MRISDWSSDVCSSDLVAQAVEQFALQRMLGRRQRLAGIAAEFLGDRCLVGLHDQLAERAGVLVLAGQHVQQRGPEVGIAAEPVEDVPIEKARVEQPGGGAVQARSEEHTSELQSLMRISYAVFCLKKKKNTTIKQPQTSTSFTQ